MYFKLSYGHLSCLKKVMYAPAADGIETAPSADGVVAGSVRETRGYHEVVTSFTGSNSYLGLRHLYVWRYSWIHLDIGEMGCAPRNLAPRNHFLVRIVKPSGCHCQDASDGNNFCEVPTPPRSTSPCL